MKPSTASFQVSFSLWVHFLAFFFKSITSKRWPLKINGEESLGRALFSGNYDQNKGVIKITAFKLKDPTKGISVNRLTYAPENQIDYLSKTEAQCRTDKARKNNSMAGEISFYGYAVIEAEVISTIKLDGMRSLGMEATPNYKNPFHGDITLPVDDGKDFYLDIADKLQRIAKFKACL